MDFGYLEKHYIKIYLLYIRIVLKILRNSNDVKTFGGCKKNLTYVAPISWNPNFHNFSLPKIQLIGEYIQYMYLFVISVSEFPHLAGREGKLQKPQVLL